MTTTPQNALITRPTWSISIAMESRFWVYKVTNIQKSDMQSLQREDSPIRAQISGYFGRGRIEENYEDTDVMRFVCSSKSFPNQGALGRMKLRYEETSAYSIVRLSIAGPILASPSECNPWESTLGGSFSDNRNGTHPPHDEADIRQTLGLCLFDGRPRDGNSLAHELTMKVNSRLVRRVRVIF